MTWTPDMDRQLAELRARGLSFGEIARAIGCGVSRNACIGRAGRIGIRVVTKITKAKPMTEAPPPKPPPPPESVEIASEPVTTLDLSHTQCKFPLGDPCEESFRHCGAKRKPGRPYCEAHCAVAFQKADKRTRKDAA
jgi:GcrA cell cycle regulator